MLNPEDFHTVHPKKMIQRSQGIIEKMLMINRIKSHLLKHINKISRLNNKNTIILQKALNILSNVMNRSCMGKNIIGSDNISLSIFSKYLVNNSRSEKIINCVNAILHCNRRNI